MKIAVGSTNPVKRSAAESVFRVLHPDARFVAVEVDSGVSAQPWGELETRTGAINRAHAAQRGCDADFGVGFEGGVMNTEIGIFLCAWVAVADRQGSVGVGGSTNMQLPPAVADLLRQGVELGEAMDRLFRTQGLKHREGAVGAFTDGLVTRQEAFEFSLKLALARFRSPAWY
jgi:inosine/xanthosine triphosphatase